MSKFDISKKVPLDYEGWEDCYLEFRLPSYGDLKDLTNDGATDQEKVDNGLKTIVELFKSGYAMSDGKKVAVTKEDLQDLPIETLTKAFKAISGAVDPK